MSYRRRVKPTVHMLKERKGVEVRTRCLTDIKMKAGESIPDVGVTGWEKDVTCQDCRR